MISLRDRIMQKNVKVNISINNYTLLADLFITCAEGDSIAQSKNLQEDSKRDQLNPPAGLSFVKCHL